MISGRWDADGLESVKIIDGAIYREILTIQIHSAKGSVYLGFGQDAVIDASLLIVTPGDSITVRGHLARQDIYALGSLSYGAYQEGDLDLNVSYEGQP